MTPSGNGIIRYHQVVLKHAQDTRESELSLWSLPQGTVQQHHFEVYVSSWVKKIQLTIHLCQIFHL